MKSEQNQQLTDKLSPWRVCVAPMMAGRSHIVEEDWPMLRMDERQPARRAAMGFVHS